MKRLAVGLIGAALLVAAGCARDRAVVSGDVKVTVDDEMRLSVTTGLSEALLVAQEAAFSGITVDGQTPVFTQVRSEKKVVNDAFGQGTALVFHGESVLNGGKVLEQLTLKVYDAFPSTVLAQAAFTNATGAPLAVEGWTMDRFEVLAGDPEPCFWTFQGQSTEDRADWLIPIRDAFYQRNFMGMNNTDYGGGTPVTCIWRRDAGLAVGHLEPVPQRVSLPVEKKAGEDKATVSVEKVFDAPVILEDGASLETYMTFFHLFKGDCFGALRQ